jgi:ferrochelatase
MGIKVAYAMRYGDPSIADTLDRLKQEGAARILILPLYPQFAASTTASVMDDVADWIKRTRNRRNPVRNYRQLGHINALASVRDHWASKGRGNSC